MKRLKVTIAQVNVTVGDLGGNLTKILEVYKDACAHHSDIIVFPELVLTGYPPEDLLLKRSFLDDTESLIGEIVRATKNQTTAIILGTPTRSEYSLFNAALFIFDSQITSMATKNNLPNYGVFDEKRYFTSGGYSHCFDFKNFRIGMIICEDMWFGDNVANLSGGEGAEIIISLNASPYEENKYLRRVSLAEDHAKKENITLIYTNLVGGQDSLVFDGGSFVVDNKGKEILRLPFFSEHLQHFELVQKNGDFVIAGHNITELPCKEELHYRAAVCGLRDYVTKNNFKKVLIGISGGIDSALTAAIAIDAVGKDNVHGMVLPSEFTSKQSWQDLRALAELSDFKYDTIDISAIFDALKKSMQDVFRDSSEDITEENMQARIRGIIDMAYSNKFGHLLLTTGNKSEYATGYATIYGDMCGGFNPIKDLYKTEIYALSNWRNNNFNSDFLGKKGRVIPESIITKEPTAELRHGQKDSDSLPHYDVLDKILYSYIEENLSVDEIVIKLNIDRGMVLKVIKLIARAQYKRKQSAPGIKLSKCSFDMERRYPITNHFI